MTTPAPLTLDQIVQAGLCIGCGLCESLAGPDRVRIVMTPEGRERPAVHAPLDDAALRLINAVCPGVTVEGPDPAASAADTQWDPVWGPALRIVTSRSGSQMAMSASAPTAIVPLRGCNP